MNQLNVLKSIVSTISHLLQSQDFLDAHRFPKYFVRNRILSMYQVVMFLLHSKPTAMHQNISQIMDLEPVHFPNVTKQAVSRARRGIMPSLFKELFDVSVDIFSRSDVPRKLWRGKKSVYAFDGSKIQIPNSPSNFEKFGEMFASDNPEKRWAMALISVIYDVMNDFIYHGLILPYLFSERAAALEHCKALEPLGILKNAVLLFDRGYYSANMFRYLSENGYSCVMRIKDAINLAKNCTGDTIKYLELKDADSGMTVRIRVRVLAIDLGNGITEYLATNLFDEEYTVADFKELYFLRWSLESKYYELKIQSMLEEFNGATSVAIEQEFYIHLLYANLTSLIKASADDKIDESPNPKNKYRYQANRAYIIGRMKKILVPILCRAVPFEEFDKLFRRACKTLSQIQPGRKRSRKHIKHERVHFNNRKATV